MLRALLISLPCLMLLPQSVVAAEKKSARAEMPVDAQHPARLLSDLFPSASFGPQRLERTLSAAEYSATTERLTASYGPPTNGRGQTVVWDVPNRSPQLDQADNASVSITRVHTNEWRLILEDRAPRGSSVAAEEFKNRGQLRASSVAAPNSAVRGKSAKLKSSRNVAVGLGDPVE